jgi:hypothetical protein
MMPTLTSMSRPLQTLKDPLHIILSPPLGEAALREVGTGSGMRLTEKEVFEHKIAQSGGLYWKGLLDGNNF